MNRKIGFVVAVSIIVIGIFLAKFMSNQKEPLKRKKTKQVAAQYKFQTITNTYQYFDIKLSGTLTSLNSVELFTEVTGIAKSVNKEYREGARFHKGDILLKIDDTEYKNNVYAQKSSLMNNLTLLIPDMKLDFPESVEKWQTYLDNFNIEKNLKPLPKANNSKEKYYIASRNIFNQYFSLKSMEARLEKYTIKAQYNGILSETMIKPGTLVRAGQKIGTYKNTDLFEMVAFASVDEVKILKVGMMVTLISDDVDGKIIGKINRINQSIDRSSQKVKVYIVTDDNRLFDGLYFSAIINVQTPKEVTKLSSDAIFNQGSVWLNQHSKFQSKNITIINRNDGYVLVAGLKNNQKVLLNPNKNIFAGKKIQAIKPQKKDK